MLDIIKSQMIATDYKEFTLDYEVLCCLKSAAIWNEAVKYRDKTIYMKPHFDRLSNKYSYSEYKQSIINDKAIHSKIQIEITEKGLQIGYLLLLHYTIEVYTSFLIEFIIRQEIESRYNIKAFASNKLDIYYKTDIKCGGCCYQIKNYSFIQGNYYIDSSIAKYEKVNSNLYFIFYTMEKDNIYFVQISGKPFLSVSEINGFTVFEQKEKITIDKLIEAVAAAA